MKNKILWIVGIIIILLVLSQTDIKKEGTISNNGFETSDGWTTDIFGAPITLSEYSTVWKSEGSRSYHIYWNPGTAYHTALLWNGAGIDLTGIEKLTVDYQKTNLPLSNIQVFIEDRNSNPTPACMGSVATIIADTGSKITIDISTEIRGSNKGLCFFIEPDTTNQYSQSTEIRGIYFDNIQLISSIVKPLNSADTNSDYIITLSEVIDYANKWINNQGVTLSQVISSANIWATGGSY